MARSGEMAAEVIAMKRTASIGRPPQAEPGRTAEPAGACPRRLPVVRIRGRLYYRDDRLQEYRATDAPWERVTFEEMAWIVVILGKWPA